MVDPSPPQSTRLSPSQALALAAILTVTVATLHGMGQPWWCALADLSPWSLDIDTAHNSQHLIDPYTLTHVLHGILLYAAVWALLGHRLDAPGRFIVAIGVEAAWEIWENTDFIIQRYREATISLDYFGDSILNSLGDIAACALGYAAAMTLPLWGSIATAIGLEAILLLWIRDSLALNVVMLVWPIDAIKSWQTGA